MGKFWKAIFKVLGTRLDMSTADHPQTDGQTERVNRVLGDVLRSVCAETPWRWSSILPIVEFAMKKFRLCLDRIYSVLRERPHTPTRSVDATTTWLRAW